MGILIKLGVIRVISPPFQQLLHICRHLTLEVQMLTRRWMLEAKHTGMQCLPRTYLKAVFNELTVTTEGSTFQDGVASV